MFSPSHVVASYLWPHFSRSRERLKGLWEEILVKQTLTVEEVEEGQSTVECVVVWLKDTCSLVVENGGGEVAQMEEDFSPLHVVQHCLWLQVDSLVQAVDSFLIMFHFDVFFCIIIAVIRGSIHYYITYKIALFQKMYQHNKSTAFTLRCNSFESWNKIFSVACVVSIIYTKSIINSCI